MSQWGWWGLPGWPPAGLTLPLQWSVVCVQSFGHTSGQDTHYKASASMLVFSAYSTTENCSWQGWPPINDSWHPALLLLAHTSGGYYQYIHQRPNKDTRGISHPWPT